jgi:predicted MPP superfamily phosphohydrolase
MNRRRFPKSIFWGTAAVLLGSYPVLIERNWVRINTYRVPVKSLPKAFNGFRAVHLTDLHLGPLVSEAFIEKVIKKANHLRPDIIVCAGDYVHAKKPTKEIDTVILSGHTHGGQVSIPFYGPPVLPVRNKKYSSGLIKTEKGNLFISRGIGWTIYPIRFNCYPEIAVLELEAV